MITCGSVVTNDCLFAMVADDRIAYEIQPSKRALKSFVNGQERLVAHAALSFGIAKLMAALVK